MRNYVDHFSEHSAEYLHYRPDYPDALFEYLASLVSDHNLVWDVGTGNGQAANKLSFYFKNVYATDQSQAQLDIAHYADNIQYICCPADKTELQDRSIDLVTVAQALHWFPLDDFYREVKRVLKPEDLIAVWCYSLNAVDAPINHLIKKLYSEILKNDWPKERAYIDEGYQTIPFPFKKKLTPKFLIERNYNLQEYLGYLNTWSAVKEYEKKNKQNPIELIGAELKKGWGSPETKHRIIWPIHLLVGQS